MFVDLACEIFSKGMAKSFNTCRNPPVWSAGKTTRQIRIPDGAPWRTNSRQMSIQEFLLFQADLAQGIQRLSCAETAIGSFAPGERS